MPEMDVYKTVYHCGQGLNKVSTFLREDLRNIQNLLRSVQNFIFITAIREKEKEKKCKVGECE